MDFFYGATRASTLVPAIILLTCRFVCKSSRFCRINNSLTYVVRSVKLSFLVKVARFTIAFHIIHLLFLLFGVLRMSLIALNQIFNANDTEVGKWRNFITGEKNSISHRWDSNPSPFVTNC